MKQFFTILAVSLLLAGCAGSADSISQIKMAGSTTLDPVMNLIIETYSQENPSLSLSYEALGSTVGIKSLIDGSIDLAGSSRDLKEQEVKEGLVAHVIGLDGIAVIVNIDSGVKDLTTAQIASIFSGKVSNWSEVGGKDLPIILVKRDESSGTYTSFKELVLGKEGYAQKGLVVNSNGDMMSKVAYTVGSIGYIGMSYVADVDRSKSTIVAVNGALPADKTILDGTYPLSRQVYLVTKGKTISPAVQNLLNFVLSPEGQDLVLSAGFFPAPQS